MRKSNSIVRTKTIFSPTNMDKYYRIDLMTYEKYIDRSEYICYGEIFELYPYKWYDLRYLYEIPSYWLLLSIFRIREVNISKQMHKITSIVVLITEMFSFIKIIISFIDKF